MIYTYFFTDKFFNDWRSNLNSEQAQKVNHFFIENFQVKENIFYCGDEKIFNRNFGVNGTNTDLINYFLTNFINNGGSSIFSQKKNIADFIFCGDNEEVDKSLFSITCEKILNIKNFKKIINKKTEDLWFNEKGKPDLINKLNKLLKLSSSVFFVDRHVPGVVADQKEMQIKQWNKSLIFFKTILTNAKVKKSFFINGVNNDVLKRYEKKKLVLKDQNPNIIDLNSHEMLKDDLRKFYKILKDVKTVVIIKDKKAYFTGLHDRFIFCFFDNNHILKEALNNNTLLIIEVSQGLNILDNKGKTTLPRRLTRRNKEDCEGIVDEWSKNVENMPNFDKFIAGEEIDNKKAS